jgi:Ca2+-binding EF-hand superfamily protein
MFGKRDNGPKMDDWMEEKLRNDLNEKGYIDRKEFTRYMRSSPFKTEEDVDKIILESEKNPIKKAFKAFILSL